MDSILMSRECTGAQNLQSGLQRVAGAERALHEHAVDPAAELEADRGQIPGGCEAEAAVQSDRSAVSAVADDGQHLSPRAALATSDELSEQCSADAASVEPAIDVDGIFHRVAV